MTRRTLQDDVLDTLGQAIVSHGYETGEVLRTEDISEQFDASRSVVREALKVLESMKIISMQRRIGITIRRREDWNVFNPRIIRWRLNGDEREAQLVSLTRLREAVEPTAARYAAIYASDQERADLTALAEELNRCVQADDLESFQDADIRYHSLLLQSSDNEMFAALAEVIAEVLRGRNPPPQRPHRPTDLALELHARAAHSIGAKDGHAAAEAIRAVLSEVHEQITEEPLATVDDQQPPADT